MYSNIILGEPVKTKHFSRKRRVMKEIRYLLKLAVDPNTPVELADEYVELIRKISMRTRTRLPRGVKLFICRKCKRILRPGVTAVFRVRSRPKKAIAVKCLRCGYTHKYVYE